MNFAYSEPHSNGTAKITRIFPPIILSLSSFLSGYCISRWFSQWCVLQINPRSNLDNGALFVGANVLEGFWRVGCNASHCGSWLMPLSCVREGVAVDYPTVFTCCVLSRDYQAIHFSLLPSFPIKNRAIHDFRANSNSFTKYLCWVFLVVIHWLEI